MFEALLGLSRNTENGCLGGIEVRAKSHLDIIERWPIGSEVDPNIRLEEV